nr:replication initiator protein A [Staphylococcus simulans]
MVKSNCIIEVYFIFTNESLQNILDKSKNTITKIKKELQEVGLLEQIRTGFNKLNKLYLHDKKLTYHNDHTHHSNHYNSNFNDESLKFQLL